jgi:hypothetical protein
MKEKRTQITFRIEPDILEQLERIAEKEGCTVSQKIEQILESGVLDFRNKTHGDY